MEPGNSRLPGLSNADQTRADTEIFLVCSMEMRIQLGALQEFPSLPSTETNQNYAQKTVQILALAHKSMKVAPTLKKCLKRCEWGKKSIRLD